MTIIRQPFGVMADGQLVDCYTLTNQAGMEARIMTYGATLISLKVPDRQGKLGDVVLGFDTLPPYLGDHPYLGGVIGRYANRIAGGSFELQGRKYQLTQNEGSNHLHGGYAGFNRRLWKALPQEAHHTEQVVLHYLSHDGEEGYPGNVQVEVVYTLTDYDELRIDFRAHTDAPTIINLTHHAYFNLASKGDILGHQLRIVADRYLPVDGQLIPTGEQASVVDTPMDFRRLEPIGSRIQEPNAQLLRASGGYDHNWVLDKSSGVLAAELCEQASGRRMQLHTTQPGLQFYSGNFFDGAFSGKSDQPYEKYAGLCLEPQHFPDSPNQPDFPSTALTSHDFYQQTAIYTFDTVSEDYFAKL